MIMLLMSDTSYIAVIAIIMLPIITRCQPSVTMLLRAAFRLFLPTCRRRHI